MSPPVGAVTVVTDVGPEPKTDNEPSKSGKAIVGIIYPPPEIRNIVDKTASFVARNGPEFANRIRDHERNNPKFNFLNPGDPYHAYYLHKVNEFAEGKAIEPATPAVPVTQKAVPQKVQDAIKAAAEFIPKDPPLPFEFVSDPATINAFDLDLIKLTAQFVARNGRQFLTQLMTREARNYQFDFLKPQHSNFAYFTKLVEQYTKILLPPKDIVEKLTRELDDPRIFFDSVKYRVEWERYQRRLKEKEDAEAENERMAYAMVDWHDFVVVQTVDFQPHETLNLPPPCTPKDVGARILAQQRLEVAKAAAQVAEMEVESGESDEGEGEKSGKRMDEGAGAGDEEGNAGDMSTSHDSQKQQRTRAKGPNEVTQQPIPIPPKLDSVNVRRDYVPKSKQVEKAKKADDQWVISPLTGERIPADKLSDHLRFNTVDPQYFAQRQRDLQEKQDDEPVYAPGMDISAAIKDFASRRTDIFGVGSKGAEQTAIGKKLGEEERPRYDPKAIWDGHTTSVEATTKAAQANVSIEDQIAQIHRTQGLVEDQDKERIGPHSDSGPLDAAGIRATAESISAPPVKAPPQQPASSEAAPPRTTAPHPPAPRPPAPVSSAPRFQQVPGSQSAAAAAQNMLASFAMRPMATATVVPMVQMQPTPVMLVQQPSLGVVPGGLYAASSGQLQMGAGPGHQFGGFHTFGGHMGGPMGLAPSSMGMDDEGPPMKRQRTEDQLLPESQWLEQYGSRGPIAVRVEVPVVPDKPEWKLNGQIMTISLALSEQVSTIKAKIQESTTMPASKQKLVFEGMFIKDSNTLAFYNMYNGAAVQLQLKERGGRKK